MLFKEGESGRPVSTDDLKEVFARRKVFDYANRPRFVVIENDKSNTICQMNEKSAQEKLEKEVADLEQAWTNLQEEQIDECYKVVYERLPLSTAKNFIERFRKESKAIIFAEEQKDFVKHLGETLSEHVNEVILKKNIHPVMQDIHKGVKTIKRRIGTLISKQNKAINSPSQHKKFSRVGNLSFQLCLDEREDDEYFANLCNEMCALDLLTVPSMVDVHVTLIDHLFKQELTMQQLISKLKAALQEHYKALLETSERDNGLLVSDASFILFAEMSCETLVNKFIEEDARDFINTSLKRLANKKPNREMKRQWKDSQNDKERRKILLEEHFDVIVQYLSRILQKGPRKQQGLLKLLEELPKAIDERMLWGLEVDDSPNINKDKLQLIMDKNKRITAFSLKIIRDKNPHPEHDQDFLDSKKEFPNPFKVVDDHGPMALPSIDHTSSLKNVCDMLKKGKKGVLDELRRKLKLRIGSLTVPEDLPVDEFKWTKILLNLLYDSNFHHPAFGEQHIPAFLKLSIPKEYISTAKEQLFAFEQSTVKCKLVEDDSIHSDTINIQFNESKDGVIAVVNASLKDELMKLNTVKDPVTQLAPIFIPSIHCGPSKDALGNLYLEEDPWTDKDQGHDKEDETAVEEQNKAQAQPTGLEDLNATTFCVVEPMHLAEFRSCLIKKPPKSNITLRFVVLPQDGRGIGVSRSIIKILAECLELPFYWTIDDDIKLLKEFNKNSRHWKRCTIGRALLYGQRVLQDCTKKVVNDLDEEQRSELSIELMGNFPKWAKKARTKAVCLLTNDDRYAEVKRNISNVNAHFSKEIMSSDCCEDPAKETEWLEAKRQYIKKFKEHLLKNNFKRIGRVSIGNESGRRNGYYSRCDMHYRKSPQNYQMVLHNTEALIGFNYVSDDVLLQKEGGTVSDKKLRDIPDLGLKWEDKSFCKALEFYGIIGYQVITVALRSEKLRNVFGRIGNSYKPEECETVRKKMDGKETDGNETDGNETNGNETNGNETDGNETVENMDSN